MSQNSKIHGCLPKAAPPPPPPLFCGCPPTGCSTKGELDCELSSDNKEEFKSRKTRQTENKKLNCHHDAK